MDLERCQGEFWAARGDPLTEMRPILGRESVPAEDAGATEILDSAISRKGSVYETHTISCGIYFCAITECARGSKFPDTVGHAIVRKAAGRGVWRVGG